MAAPMRTSECIIHACQACPDFVVVAHPQLEVSGDEGREGGDILALSWQCTSLSWLVAGHTRVERQPRYALGSLFLKFHRRCRRICPLPLRRRVPYREVEHGQDRAGDYHQQRSENDHGVDHIALEPAYGMMRKSHAFSLSIAEIKSTIL